MRLVVAFVPGAGTVEHVIVIGLVALAALGAYRLLSNTLRSSADDEGARLERLEGYRPNVSSAPEPSLGRGAPASPRSSAPHIDDLPPVFVDEEPAVRGDGAETPSAPEAGGLIGVTSIRLALALAAIGALPPEAEARSQTGPKGPPSATTEQALVVVSRPGVWALLDRMHKHAGGNYSRDGVITVARLRSVAEDAWLPADVREAARAVLDDFDTVSKAAQDVFGIERTRTVQRGRWPTTEKYRVWGQGRSEGQIQPRDLVAEQWKTMSDSRAVAILQTAFDAFDVTGPEGKPDGRLIRSELEAAIDRTELPLELRAAAVRILNDKLPNGRTIVRELDTAAGDARGATHVVREATGRQTWREVTVTGEAADGVIERESVDLVTVDMLARSVDTKPALEILRLPSNWHLAAPSGAASRVDLEALSRRPGVPMDLRIAARWLSEPGHFAAIAGASRTLGLEEVVVHDDLQVRRVAMEGYGSAIRDLPPLTPDPAAAAEFERRVRDFATRLRGGTKNVIWQSERDRVDLARRVHAANRDGIRDQEAEALRAEYRQKVGALLSATANPTLAKEFAALMAEAVALYGGDALTKSPSLTLAISSTRDVDDARADFIALGRIMASQSEVRDARNEDLVARRYEILAQMDLAAETLADGFYATDRKLRMAKKGFFSVIGSAMNDHYRWLVPGSGPTDRELWENFRAYVGAPGTQRLQKIRSKFHTASAQPADAKEASARYDEFWAHARSLSGALSGYDHESGRFAQDSANWRDGYTSMLAALPALTGVGVVWTVALGAAIKGGSSVVDDVSAGRSVSWSDAGYNGAVGGLEGLSGGAGGLLGKGAQKLAQRTVVRSLGPRLVEELGVEAGLRTTVRLARGSGHVATTVVRGPTTGAMVGAIRPSLAGATPEQIAASIAHGAKWGLLVDAALSTAAAGFKARLGRGPARVAEPRPSATPHEAPAPTSAGSDAGRPAASGTFPPGRGVDPPTRPPPPDALLKPGGRVRLRRAGRVEDDWTIVGWEEGELVAVNPRGVEATADIATVLEHNPDLVLGVEVRGNSALNRPDDGWHVDGFEDGMFRLTKAGKQQLRKSSELVALNPEMAGGSVKPGLAEVLADPSSLAGKTVRVPVGRKALDEGWTVAEVTPGGKAVVRKGGKTLELSLEELLGHNHYLVRDPRLPRAEGPVPLRRARVKPDSAASAQSDRYRTRHRLEPGENIEDGFVDGGRETVVGPDSQITPSQGREVIVVDRGRDARLREQLSYAKSLRHLPEVERAQALAEYVDAAMAPPSGMTAEATNKAWLKTRAGYEVLLGDVPALQGGTCRHRALLFKVLADEAGLSVSQVRGFMGRRSVGPHVWNELTLRDGRIVIVDVTGPQPFFRFPSVGEVEGLYWGSNKRPLYGAGRGAAPAAPERPGPSVSLGDSAAAPAATSSPGDGLELTLGPRPGGNAARPSYELNELVHAFEEGDFFVQRFTIKGEIEAAQFFGIRRSELGGKLRLVEREIELKLGRGEVEDFVGDDGHHYFVMKLKEFQGKKVTTYLKFRASENGRGYEIHSLHPNSRP